MRSKPKKKSFCFHICSRGRQLEPTPEQGATEPSAHNEGNQHTKTSPVGSHSKRKKTPTLGPRKALLDFVITPRWCQRCLLGSRESANSERPAKRGPPAATTAQAPRYAPPQTIQPALGERGQRSSASTKESSNKGAAVRERESANQLSFELSSSSSNPESTPEASPHNQRRNQGQCADQGSTQTSPRRKRAEGPPRERSQEAVERSGRRAAHRSTHLPSVFIFSAGQH